MKKPTSARLAHALLCALAVWALAAHADTFTNKKTGKVLQGKLITRTQRDGKSVIFAKLDDGKSVFLHEEEWQAAVTEPPPEPRRKAVERPKGGAGYDAAVAAVPLDDLAGAKKVYLEQRTALGRKHQNPGAANYRKALAAIEERFVRKGDLEGVLAVRREAERFATSASVAEDTVVKKPKELAALQKDHRELEQRATALRKREHSALTKLHVARLEEMKKHLTTQRRIDEALAVAKEIERVEADRSPEGAPDSEPPGPPSARDKVPLKLAKPCREARSILQSIMKQMPDPFSDLQEVQLVSVHDAVSLSRHSGGPARVKGACARQALVGSSGGILMSGPYEKLGRGDWAIAYRFGFLDPVEGSAVCFVDVASGGVTAAGCRPNADRFKPKSWTLVPQFLRNGHERSFEYRFWPQGHRVAIDRIYVFKLLPKSE